MWTQHRVTARLCACALLVAASSSADHAAGDARTLDSRGTTARALSDQGIFPDLDERVRVQLAPWGSREAWGHRDTDGDGIADALDILLGAKKVALDAAPYIETYRAIPFPMGDVPRSEGVCTDVVVRALRNAGIDLQKAIHEDAKRESRAYPGIRRLDPNIDHRRVKNQLHWFARHFSRVRLSEERSDQGLRPGDIVFLDTFPSRPGGDHVGIVSDQMSPEGVPLVINAWTTGFVASEMPLLGAVPVTDAFRAPSSEK